MRGPSRGSHCCAVPWQRLSCNRSLAAAAYDAAGNLTWWGGFCYEWRPTGELRTRTGTGLNKWFAYDAGGERVVVHDRLGDTLTFTIRDLDGRVLRVFERDALGSWSWEKDYVYRNGLLLAAKDPAGTVHFTLDHLGTPRYVTDAAGNELARHSYFGFGEEATTTWRDEAMKFTGHERDLEDTPNRLDDLDYMHARYYNPLLGRFLSVDPVGGAIGASQSFNRYAYVGNSPLNYVDPFGLARLVADRNGAYHFEDEIEVNADAPENAPRRRTSQNGRLWLRKRALTAFQTQDVAQTVLSPTESTDEAATGKVGKLANDDPGLEGAAHFYHYYVAPLKDPLILSSSHIASGSVVVYAGGVLTFAGFVAAPETMGVSLILSGAGIVVTGGGVYIIGCGIDHALHGLNQLDQFEIPTLSDRWSIFPSSPYEDHR